MKTKIINDGLPEPIYKALCNDKYNAGDSDYTPSSLMQPAYQRKVMDGAEDYSITEPASSRIWSLLGSSVHYMIELAGEDMSNYICEHRFYGDIEVNERSFKIGSQVDIWDTKNRDVYDMKTTSVWSVIGKPKPEWIAQLNVNRWCIWKESGELANRLVIVAILRDWTQGKIYERGYPKSPIVQVNLPIWDLMQTEEWIADRVKTHEAYKALPLSFATPCSDAETWAKPDVFAVMKAGRKSAVKLYDNEHDAALRASGDPLLSVQVRKGQRVRCERYCACKDICPSFRAQ